MEEHNRLYELPFMLALSSNFLFYYNRIDSNMGSLLNAKYLIQNKG